MTAELFWDEHYGAHRGGRPANPLLVETAAPLHPGAALDLGCGAGGDTIWLARQGWQVTAVDISTTAVECVGERARELGLGGRVVTERHDLVRTFPGGEFDLVSAQYLHTPFTLPRNRVLRSAARALRPGGLLLIVDHGSTAPWSWNQDPDTHYPTPTQTAAELDLDPEQWRVLRADMPRRRATGPAGETATVTDNVLVVQRHPDMEWMMSRSRTQEPTSRKRDTGPPQTGPDEKDVLWGFLDHLRSAIADKAADAPEPQVRTGGVPSGTGVLGLVKHLAFVERFYFLGEQVDDWGATMRPTPEETVNDVLADYRETIERANEVIDTWTDLTLPAPRPPRRRGSGPSMRWVLVHMIEETGRHTGHADILREQIDGSTGR